jgi:hypothetical protein
VRTVCRGKHVAAMSACRLVWSRIWAVLSDYFIEVGCHPNLEVGTHMARSTQATS